MPVKKWFDGLTPIETAAALSRLNRQSLSGQYGLDFFQSRFNAVSSQLPPEIRLSTQQHLDQLKPRRERKKP